MLDYHKIEIYSKRDKHQIALKKFCSKIIFGIKLENIMLLKIFMNKHLLEFKKRLKKQYLKSKKN